MSEEKKICPFMSKMGDIHLFEIECLEKKCVAWGVVKVQYANTARPLKEYGCKLIEKP